MSDGRSDGRNEERIEVELYNTIVTLPSCSYVAPSPPLPPHPPIDIMLRSPNLFETFIVSIDIINMSTEAFLHTITEVFANGGKAGIPELGVGNAEELVVFNAWQRHEVLYDNHKKLYLMERIMYIVLAVTCENIGRAGTATPFLEVGGNRKDR